MEGYGRWVQTPDYGNVWTPQVGADWAPYHYGRWFYNTGYGGWCWWPGSIYARHYWAPAYVGFEDRFRGSREAIRARVEDYVPVLAAAGDVVDLGCGRGELLDLLRDEPCVWK